MAERNTVYGREKFNGCGDISPFETNNQQYSRDNPIFLHEYRAGVEIRAATGVGIPTNSRYTDYFQDPVFFTKLLLWEQCIEAVSGEVQRHCPLGCSRVGQLVDS